MALLTSAGGIGNLACHVINRAYVVDHVATDVALYILGQPESTRLLHSFEKASVAPSWRRSRARQCLVTSERFVEV
ncbi:hypothetical protein LIER_08339 [Lithospermum erythrorhizon]|uniref:Uncharacterized protein n=1 Tax=Lithospermum erythrorhizon TaxID=34254 RepID=A0AAV3PDJ0_LITER